MNNTKLLILRVVLVCFCWGAYQYLLDWYGKHSGKLTLAKRRKILTDNIFGVDIDPIAVGIM